MSYISIVMKSAKSDLASQIQTMTLSQLDKIIEIYRPPFKKKFIFGFLYYILVASSIVPQYFNLFKFVDLR